MSVQPHGFKGNSELHESEALVARVFRVLPKCLRRVKLYKLLRAISNKRARLIRIRDGLQFYGDLDDGGPIKAIINQSFDQELCQLLHQLLPKKSGVFFDVGANYGLASLSLHHVYGHRNTKFHLFEANKTLVSALEKSLGRSVEMSFQLNYSVVSDADGSSSLSCNGSNSGAAFAVEYQGDGDEIPNLILGDYVLEQNVEVIDVLKIDIEGYEVKALKGLFSKPSVRPKFLVLEVDSGHLSRASSSVSELFSILELNGYTLFHWRANDYEESYKWNDFCLSKNTRQTKQINGNDILLTPVANSNADESNKWGTDILAIHVSS